MPDIKLTGLKPLFITEWHWVSAGDPVCFQFTAITSILILSAREITTDLSVTTFDILSSVSIITGEGGQ
jgi:hypothetical protein